MAGALLATSRVVHESIANGMMGMMLPIYAIPVLSVALVAWAVATRDLSMGPRRASMVATILIASAAFILIRTGGITEIFIAQGQPVEALIEQLLDAMIDEPLVARIAEAGGQFTAQAQAAIDLAEQKRAAVGAQVAAGKVGLHLAGTQVLEKKRLLAVKH
jgi:hypothetical protein